MSRLPGQGQSQGGRVRNGFAEHEALMFATLSKAEIASALGKPKPTRYLNESRGHHASRPQYAGRAEDAPHTTSNETITISGTSAARNMYLIVY